MRTIQKIILHIKSGKKFLIKDTNEDFSTQFGVVPASELKSDKESLKSNKGEKFIAFNPTFPDLWENLVRGPQVMLPKDIGMIIAKTGVNKNYKVVDAGGGSGSLCLYLASLCQEVTTYEINPEHYGVLQKNKQLFNLSNLNLKQENIYKGIAETELDLITLDLPEPWQALTPAEKALKTGAFLVAYLPNLTQVQKFIEACQRSRINVLETIELLERKWKIEENILRPEFQMLGHTGFLVFCRKF